jgi:hypothetical protein
MTMMLRGKGRGSGLSVIMTVIVGKTICEAKATGERVSSELFSTGKIWVLPILFISKC